LPSTVEAKVHGAAQQLRKGKTRERFLTFARSFLNEIYSGEKTVSFVPPNLCSSFFTIFVAVTARF
jgi:hypothetical protein